MAVTLTSRSVGLMVATAVAAGWLGASLTQPEPPAQSSSLSTPRRSIESRPVPRADKLRELLATPPLPSRGRNPFVYGPRAATARDHQQHGNEAVASAPGVEVPMAPPAPIFKLSGIASNQENGAAVLTAIVIDNGSMVFVKTGDKLSNGYSVVRVEEMSVTIVDAAGVTQTLKLP
ncbi:MAG: hypothetical protein K2Y23_14500 [Cyanobacteria bacterium]|nr:hypothetical protein [Cyanobacteriota bacterium]